MASNKDLMADITALCNERGVAVPEGLEQLKNPKLLELLGDLRQASVAGGNAPPAVVETALRPLVAPTPPEGAETPGDESDEGGQGNGDTPSPGAPAAAVQPPVLAFASTPAAPARQAEATGAAGYFVAEGKTVDPGTGRDRQGAFQEVFPSDFAEGVTELEALRAAGYLFKR